MKIKLPFKTRRELKSEIDHLTEQLRISSDERRKDNARARSREKELEDLCEQLEKCIEAFGDSEKIIAFLKKELNEQKAVNAGLSSSVTELKSRNKTLAAKVRSLEEKQNTTKPKTTRTRAASEKKTEQDPFAA